MENNKVLLKIEMGNEGKFSLKGTITATPMDACLGMGYASLLFVKSVKDSGMSTKEALETFCAALGLTGLALKDIVDEEDKEILDGLDEIAMAYMDSREE